MKFDRQNGVQHGPRDMAEGFVPRGVCGLRQAQPHGGVPEQIRKRAAIDAARDPQAISENGPEVSAGAAIRVANLSRGDEEGQWSGRPPAPFDGMPSQAVPHHAEKFRQIAIGKPMLKQIYTRVAV